MDAGWYPWDAGGPFVYDGYCESIETCHRGPAGGGRAQWVQYLYADGLDWQLVAADPCSPSVIYAASYRPPAVFEGVQLPDPAQTAPDSGPANQSIILARLDARDGRVIWARFFGGADAYLDVQQVEVRNDRRIVITGAYSGGGDIGLGTDLPFVPGGEALPFVSLLSVDGEPEKAVVVTGHAYGWFRPGSVNGNHVIFGGPFAGDWLELAGSRVNLVYPDGGYHYSNLIYDFDENLSPRLVRNFDVNPPQEEYQSLASLAVDKDGALYAAIHYDPAEQLVKFASDGGNEWVDTLDPGDSFIWQVAAVPGGGVAVARPSQLGLSVSQLLADGGANWNLSFQSQPRTIPLGLTVASNGQLTIALRTAMQTSLDFGIGAVSSYLPDAGLYEKSDFLLSFDADGEPVWSEAFPHQPPSPSVCQPIGGTSIESATTTPAGLVVASGAGDGCVDFGDGWRSLPSGSYPHSGTGFVAAFSQ